MQLRRTYCKRPVRFLHLAEDAGWKMKVYGIRYRPTGPNAADSEYPDPDIVAYSEEFLLSQLPQPAATPDRHGVGFLIIHQGEHRNWMLLDWWYDQEILKQRLYSSPLYSPRQITPAEVDLCACTWELAVHGFERQAWVETVLNNDAGPDLDAYLRLTLSADV